MIDNRLLKIASNTKYYGLKNNYTYKSKLKNSTCGDKISIEITLKKNTIREIRYETESCIFCQASASTLANIAKNTKLGDFKTNLSYLHLSVDYQHNFDLIEKVINKLIIDKIDASLEDILKVL